MTSDNSSSTFSLSSDESMPCIAVNRGTDDSSNIADCGSESAARLRRYARNDSQSGSDTTRQTDSQTPKLTSVNVARCMWSFRQLPQIEVTARLLDGKRVCLAELCHAPSRPIMTWPGHYSVRSALMSSDWMVEVVNPDVADIESGSVWQVTNFRAESVYVRRLAWQPQYIMLHDGSLVAAGTQSRELCIGHGAVQSEVVINQVEVSVINTLIN